MSSLNLRVFNFIYSFAHRNFLLDGTAIFFAEWLAYLLVFGFLVLVFFQKGTRRKLYVFCEGALAVILARGIVAPIIQFFYYHPRPFEMLGFTPLIAESGTSFPSAHMTLFFALGLAIWYSNRTWGTWYLIFAALMGVARIYVGIHWPLDILAGAAIGIISAMFAHWLLKNSRKELERLEVNG